MVLIHPDPFQIEFPEGNAIEKKKLFEPELIFYFLYIFGEGKKNVIPKTKKISVTQYYFPQGRTFFFFIHLCFAENNFHVILYAKIFFYFLVLHNARARIWKRINIFFGKNAFKKKKKLFRKFKGYFDEPDTIFTML